MNHKMTPSGAERTPEMSPNAETTATENSETPQEESGEIPYAQEAAFADACVAQEEESTEAPVTQSAATTKTPDAAMPKTQSAATPKTRQTKSKSNRTKTVAVRSLQQEIKRWQKLKIADQMCLKLMRLYLGEPDHLDENGIYRMSSLFQMSSHLCNKQSRKFIDAICLSGSFYFLVKANYSKVYGFFSPLTINEKGLENYHIRNEELEGIPLVNLRLVNLRQPTRKFTTGDKEYIILMSIEKKEHIIPPSEETRLPGLRAGGLIPWDAQTEQNGGRGSQSGKPKEDFGSAAEFFHEMKLSEEGQKTVIDPLRQLILKHYPSMTRGEANIVLGNLVVSFLIPLFDRNPKFRTKPTAGRISWLHALVHKVYFVNTLQHAYECSKAQLVEFQNRQTEEQQQRQRNSLRNYRPLSPYEWTNTTSGARRYEDAQGQVIDLPAEAPARPSATAAWNPFLQQWEEPDGFTNQMEPDAPDRFANQTEPDDPDGFTNRTEPDDPDGNGNGWNRTGWNGME